MAAALAETESEMRARTDAVLGADRPPLERVEAYLRLPREALVGCPLGRLVHEPAIEEEEAIRSIVAPYFAHVQRGVADALGEARTDDDLGEGADPDELAAALFAVLLGGYVLARASRDPGQMDRAAKG